jgi:hypothetical protein
MSDSTSVLTPRQAWITHTAAWADVCRHFYKHGFETFSFLPYSKKAVFQRFNPTVPLDPDDINVDEATLPSPKPPGVSQSPQRTTQQRPPPPFRSPPAQTSTAPTADSTDDADAHIEELLCQAQEKRRRLEELSQLQEENSRLEQNPTAATDAQSQLLLAMAQHILDSTEAKPQWDGEDSTKRHFLEEMQVFKSHRYFSKVTNWTAADASHQDHSLHLRHELLRTIYSAMKAIYCKSLACARKMLAKNHAFLQRCI